VLFDLAAADGRRFSPHCWRSAMVLAHKGLECASRATLFTGISAIGDGSRTLPVDPPVSARQARLVTSVTPRSPLVPIGCRLSHRRAVIRVESSPASVAPSRDPQ
jgi:hypothetical protein